MRQNSRTATPLGQLMQRQMTALGMKKQVDAARATGLSEATISRLLYDDVDDPDQETRDKLEKGLHITEQDLRRALAGEEIATEESAIPWKHPLAAEMDRMLAPDSPLSDEERGEVESLVNRILLPLRPKMRRSKRAV